MLYLTLKLFNVGLLGLRIYLELVVIVVDLTFYFTLKVLKFANEFTIVLSNY
jgi:hypothetical protein